MDCLKKEALEHSTCTQNFLPRAPTARTPQLIMMDHEAIMAGYNQAKSAGGWHDSINDTVVLVHVPVLFRSH